MRRFQSSFTPEMNNGKSVLVFGSNLAGKHDKGTALTAKQHWGAIQGQGAGFQGRSYAIPTKSVDLETLPLDFIKYEVRCFISNVRLRPDQIFLVTAIGTGLAGYRHDQIAPMFKDAPDNCVLPVEWKEFL